MGSISESFTRLVCVVLTISLFSCCARALNSGDYTRVFTGEGTYYGASAGGNCAMRGALPPLYAGMLPVAINDPQYAHSASCGACILIMRGGRGSGGTPIDTSRGPIRAYVHDRCPECKRGDLDLSVSGDGRWRIEWKFVPCEAPPAQVQVQILFEGSNEYYRKMQVRGLTTPVVTFVANGVVGTRTQDNFFVFHNGQKWPTSVDVEFVTVAGKKINGRLEEWKSDGVVMVSGIRGIDAGGTMDPANEELQVSAEPTPSMRPMPTGNAIPRRKKGSQDKVAAPSQPRNRKTRTEKPKKQTKRDRNGSANKKKGRGNRTRRSGGKCIASRRNCRGLWSRWRTFRCCNKRLTCRRSRKRGPFLCLPVARRKNRRCRYKWKSCGWIRRGRRVRCCGGLRCKWVRWAGAKGGRRCVPRRRP